MDEIITTPDWFEEDDVIEPEEDADETEEDSFDDQDER